MRHIENRCLKSMTSPIKYVMMHIHNAIINIAPENKEKFDKVYPDFILKYLDDYKFIANVDTVKKYIKLSRRVVEILWAVSYGYTMYYTKIVQDKKILHTTIIDLHADSDVKQAMKLLKWIYESWLNDDNDNWPDELPKPIKNPQKGSMENVADELCLCAISYIIHHELSHIKLKHPNEENIENEKEVDIEATDWILNHSLDQWDYKFIKRAMGIAIGFEVQTARGIYTGDYGGISHPYSYDRLYQNLNRYIDDPQHITWAFICSTLKLHLDNKKIQTPDQTYDSFQDCVNSYIDLLSRNI